MHVTESNKPAPKLDEIQRALESLLDVEHVPAEYVRFRMDLLGAQWAARLKLGGYEDTPACGGGEVLSSARPVLGVGDVVFNRESLLTLFEALCRAVEAQGGQCDDAARLAAAACEDSDLLMTLAERATFGPDHEYLLSLAQRLEVGAESLLFFGRVLAAPFVSAAADRAGGGSAASSKAGICATCGAPPAIAQLRTGDGKRILHCSLCGQSHVSPRLECPHCGSIDREGLVYLRISADDPRWIEACESCREYVKVVDARRLPEGTVVIPLVEDVATVYLDLLAEREGYHRRLPHVALV